MKRSENIRERLETIVRDMCGVTQGDARDVVGAMLDALKEPTDAMAITLLSGPRICNYSDLKFAKILVRRVMKSLRTGKPVNQRYGWRAWMAR